MDQVEAQKISNVVGNILSLDNNCEDGQYYIRSLYFDSIENHDFHSKMNGDENRKKIRLRIYDLDTDKVKIEIKYKNNINQIKESMWISREDAIELIKCNYFVLLSYNNDLSNKLYNLMTLGQYRPVVMVDYYRKAFFHIENDIRITFDTDIRRSESNFDLFDKTTVLTPIFYEENVVLEVKFDNEIFGWIRDLLKGRNHSNRSMSKYCESRTWM